MPKASLLTVYQNLPQTNCGECGEVNCMTFASKLLERKYAPKDCPPLVREAKYREKYQKLLELISPPVKEVRIGADDKAVKIGGKEVMYRHELTYHNSTAIAIDVSDKASDDQIKDRCKQIEGYSVVRIGDTLRLNLVAIRGASGEPKRFAEAALVVAQNCSYPFILCSFDPSLLSAALRQPEVADRRPLLYAATKDNWKDVGLLAQRHGCPVVAFEPKELRDMVSLVGTLESMGVSDIVLDPGSYTEGTGLRELINKIAMIRRSAIKKEEKGLNYPIMCVPATVWLNGGEEPATSYREAYTAGMLVARSVDLIIMHTMEPWAILPVVTLRQNIYTDPRKPVAVESGLRTFGNPDENSPVLLTTNFALTYYTVANDIESQGNNCFLLVVDTGGLAVECSVAGGQFNASIVEELVGKTGVEGKVKHRHMIIPQLAARLKGDIEDQTKWEVVVGPRDSSQIKDFLSKNWPIKN